MENEKYWMDLFEERAEKNISIRQFCRLKGITEARYHYYHKRLVKSNDNETEEAVDPMFQPVTIVDDNCEVSFMVNGLSITCNRNQIKYILGALK